MKIPVDLAARIEDAISHYPASKRSASLPLLHLWQEHFGFISDEGINWIAAKLELTPINILELVTFYPMFRRKPDRTAPYPRLPHAVVSMAGSYELKQRIAKAAGIDLEKWARGQHNGHGDPIAVSPDGRYSIEFVECLASCGTAPVAMVDDLFKENIRIDEASALLKLRESDATTPQVRNRIRGRSASSSRTSIAKAGPTTSTATLNDGGYEDLKKALNDEAGGDCQGGEEIRACAGAAARGFRAA